MIRTVKLELHAAHPNMPLEPICVFAGSAATLTILNVPRAVGRRNVTGLRLDVKTPTAEANYPAVRVGSCYEVTIPASLLASPFSADLGVKVVGLGVDEQSQPATWTLGVADLKVLNAQGEVQPGAEVGDVRHADFAAVEELPEEFTDDDVRSKMNQILTVLKGSVALAVVLALAIFRGTFAASVTLERKGSLPNTSNVVTAVSFAGLATSADLSAKADRVQGATSGNFAALDGNGNLTDSAAAL